MLDDYQLNAIQEEYDVASIMDAVEYANDIEDAYQNVEDANTIKYYLNVA